MTPLCVCLVSSLPCPKLRGIFVMITPLPVLLVPHIFFYSFALSFFFSFWSGGEVPLSTAIEVTEAVLTPGLLLFKPIQTKHILRGHDIRGGGGCLFLFLFSSVSHSLHFKYRAYRKHSVKRTVIFIWNFFFPSPSFTLSLCHSIAFIFLTGFFSSAPYRAHLYHEN